MHNMSGYEWDTWNRKMRDLLVHTQVRNVDQCANGSWAPEKDAWGQHGGRVMTTSLSAPDPGNLLPLSALVQGGAQVAAVAVARGVPPRAARPRRQRPPLRAAEEKAETAKDARPTSELPRRPADKKPADVVQGGRRAWQSRRTPVPTRRESTA